MKNHKYRQPLSQRIGDAIAATFYYSAWAVCLVILAALIFLIWNADKLPIIDYAETQLVCQRPGGPERIVGTGRFVAPEGNGIWRVGGHRVQPAYDETCWTRTAP